MAAFEYSYSFSVDEEIIQRYGCIWPREICIFETRIKFIVKAISGERIPLDWESFAISCHSLKNQFDSEGYVRLHIGSRLRDCWMSNRQIRAMSQQFFAFAKQIRATGRRGIIPAAVDVEVCTAQRQGEAIAATVERAMKPEHLPPLHLYSVDRIGHPAPPPPSSRDHDIGYLKAMSTIWVEDVEKALCAMDLCVVCGRKPIVGTQILTLLCGHAFHFHCVAHRLLEETNSCPTCNHQPAYNQEPSFESSFKYDNHGWTSSEDEDDDDDMCDVPQFPSASDPFWSRSLGDNVDDDDPHRPTTVAELFWSRLLDNDDDNNDNDDFEDDDDEPDPAAADHDSD